MHCTCTKNLSLNPPPHAHAICSFCLNKIIQLTFLAFSRNMQHHLHVLPGRQEASKEL